MDGGQDGRGKLQASGGITVPNLQYAFWVLLFLGTIPLCGQEVEKKVAIPTEAAQAEATKLIKEVYGDEWAAAKIPRREASPGKEATRKGKRDQGQIQVASSFYSENCQGHRYAGERWADCVSGDRCYGRNIPSGCSQNEDGGAEQVATSSQILPRHKSVVEEALKLVDQALSQDTFTVADVFAKLALAEARRALDRKLLTRAEQRVAEVAELAKAYEDVNTAKAKLDKTSDDPEANMVVGK